MNTNKTLKRLISLRIKNSKLPNTNSKLTRKISKSFIWKPLSSRSNILKKNNIDNILHDLGKLFYDSQTIGSSYVPNIKKQIEVFQFYFALILEQVKEDYQRSIEPKKLNSDNSDNTEDTEDAKDSYFLITEEYNYWEKGELARLWQETCNKPEVKQTYNLLQDNYKDELKKTLHNNKNISKITLLPDNSPDKNFNALVDMTNLKNKLLEKGLKQTFVRGTPNIKVLLYNSNYRSSFFNDEQALIKNRLDTQSLTCIKYKDLVYQNLILLNNLNHNFLPFSIVITEDNHITYEELNKKFDDFYSKYKTIPNVILPSNVDEHIYIARSVEFVDYSQYTASMGFGIVLIKNNEDIEEKLKPLFLKFKTVIISKFLKSKLIELKGYDHEKKIIRTGIINYNIRINFIVLVTKNPVNNNYELWVYIFKIGKFKTSYKFADTDEKNITNNTQKFDTHEGIYTSLLEPNDENEINRNYNYYFAQIENIIKNILEVLKYRVKIYPECEHSFEEFTIDLILSDNNTLYLAEVNNNSSIATTDTITRKLMRKQNKLGYNNKTFKELESAKLYSLNTYNNTLLHIMYDSIIEPILNNQEIQEIDNNDNNYKSYRMNSNLEEVPRIKNGKNIPIKN